MCININYLTPCEVAQKLVDIGKDKSKLSFSKLFLSGILAGLYIGFGSHLYTVVTHDVSRYFGLGLSKFIGGSVFSVGLVLVVLGGAELFTGNSLMSISLFKRKIALSGLFRNWSIVFSANFVGSIFLVILVYFGGLYKMGDYGVGTYALNIAVTKVNLGFLEAFLRGVACNILVVLAVWLAISGKDLVSKIAGIYFPIMAFVASGFEHSVANMYFIPLGLFLKGNAGVLAASGLGGGASSLTWSTFLVNNLVPVTLGNIVGGAIFIGGIYYFVYLKK